MENERSGHEALGAADSGTIGIRTMERFDIPACAALAVASLLGPVYGFTMGAWKERLGDAFQTGANHLIVAEQLELEGKRTVVGFAWAHERGAFMAAPYLRFIAVSETCSGRGVGTLLLDEFERRTHAVGRPWLLLVSHFNLAAIAFYERHGYHQVGRLPNLVVPGIDELLMMKGREP